MICIFKFLNVQKQEEIKSLPYSVLSGDPVFLILILGSLTLDYDQHRSVGVTCSNIEKHYLDRCNHHGECITLLCGVL